jgi:hypothetical protein
MKRAVYARALVPLGLALAILGWYAPWVTSSRQLAALTYNALDLVEFCKFVNRAGMAAITREWFLVPLVAASVALALWVHQPGALPRPARYGLTALAAVLSLVPLPPYPFMLKAYTSAEDRVSLWLCLAGLMCILLILAFGRSIAGRWRTSMFTALTMIGALPAAWEFVTRALPAISQVYGSPAWPAWGFYLTLLGFALTIAASVKPDA